jgi:hypothetical protein
MHSAGGLFEDFASLSLGTNEFTPDRLLACHEFIDRLEDEVLSRCQGQTDPMVDDTAPDVPPEPLPPGVVGAEVAAERVRTAGVGRV